MALLGLGVSGGIGAYKAVEVARLLQTQGHRVQAIMTHTLDGMDSSSLAPPLLPPAPAASAAAAAEVDEVDESVEPSAGTAEFRQVECATTEAAPPSSDTLAAPAKKPRRIEAVMTHTL